MNPTYYEKEVSLFLLCKSPFKKFLIPNASLWTDIFYLKTRHVNQTFKSYPPKI